MRSGGDGPVAGNKDHENCGFVTTSVGFTICACAAAARAHTHASSRTARRAPDARGFVSMGRAPVCLSAVDVGLKGTPRRRMRRPFSTSGSPRAVAAAGFYCVICDAAL